MTCTTPTKHCRDCKTNKPTTEFHKLKTRPDGLAIRCKLCTNRRLNPHKARIAKAKELEDGARFSIVRNTSRRTGACSWGILDRHPYDNTNPVVYIADNLKDAILECERLNTPAPKLRYTKRGQVGFVSNDDEDYDLGSP